MSKIVQLTFFLLLVSQILTRNLQTIYSVIVIGAGASGVGASAALASKNVNHIILQARDRFGGRTFSTTISNITVDLGASFIHNPFVSNAIYTYYNNLNWGGTNAGFNNTSTMYTAPNSSPNSDLTKNLVDAFGSYASNLVSNQTDVGLKDAWTSFIATRSESNDIKNKAYFEVSMQGNLNGADMNTASTIAYTSNKEKGSTDILPSTSYAALIKKIYDSYCKGAQIIYNQNVNTIDYSGSVVKITTVGGQVYYANKVINTIPLGVLKSNFVTFIPALPTDYTNAINNIGFGVFNKIIVTLNDTFWDDPGTTRVVDLAGTYDGTTFSDINFPEFYVAPTDPKVLLFFVGGNYSKTLNLKTDAQILDELKTYLAKYTNKVLSVISYNITRWQQDNYAKGSYSYYKVGTKKADYKTLMTNINNKLWFAGEHVHDSQSSNVHGAFQSGIWAGQGAGAGLFGWQLVTALWLFVALLVM